MLRVTEVTTLDVPGLEVELDGSGRLAICHSKTDQEGEGAVAIVGACGPGSEDDQWRRSDGASTVRLGRTRLGPHRRDVGRGGRGARPQVCERRVPIHATIRRGGSRGKVEVAEALLATGADPNSGPLRKVERLSETF